MKKTIIRIIATIAIVLFLSSCAPSKYGVCYVSGYNTAHQKVYGQPVKTHRQRAIKCNVGGTFATYKK